MAVKFLKQAQVGALYNKNEVAGFDDETEKKLCEGDDPVAEKLADPKAKPAA